MNTNINTSINDEETMKFNRRAFSIIFTVAIIYTFLIHPYAGKKDFDYYHGLWIDNAYGVELMITDGYIDVFDNGTPFSRMEIKSVIKKDYGFQLIVNTINEGETSGIMEEFDFEVFNDDILIFSNYIGEVEYYRVK